jgi:hypothetical protein
MLRVSLSVCDCNAGRVHHAPTRADCLCTVAPWRTASLCGTDFQSLDAAAVLRLFIRAPVCSLCAG